MLDDTPVGRLEVQEGPRLGPNCRFPAGELRCIEVICLYSSLVIAVVLFHPSRLLKSQRPPRPPNLSPHQVRLTDTFENQFFFF